MANSGNPQRGREVFNAAGSLCSGCHSVDGSASKVGPDLGAIGDKFTKRDLIRSVLEPSAVVAVGYGVTSVTTRDGEIHSGVIKSSGADTLELMGVDGIVTKIPTAEMLSQTTADVSLMPAGLHAGMGEEGFCHLIAYLESLRAGTRGEQSGNPERIPQASRAATFKPLSTTPFDHPTWFGFIPGRGTSEALVLEHTGRIWRLVTEDGKEQRELVLDLRGIIRPGGATGLLAMDFHPDYVKNRRYFLKYHIVENGIISTIIEERMMQADRDADSGKPAREILRIRSVTQDHNGGSFGFGPDGFLYFGMGDTGPQRDPQGHGQDLSMLLGKLMRIDIDQRHEGLGYAIPPDNPFIGQAGVRPEIWASGFREPYRLSWDSKTGDLWVGDVGQDRIEEVAIVRRGENHGWNVYEGHQPFSERFRRTGEIYVPPVMSYSHRHGVSVTGGYVYRGSKAPQMAGWYIFGDYETRRIWALTQHDRKLDQAVEIARAPSRITAFARDEHGELYVVGFNDGLIQRLVLDDVDPRPKKVRVVAQTSERNPVSWRIQTEPPDASWTGEMFDDSAWREGQAGFGTRGTPGGVIRTEWQTADVWLRRDFEVAPEVAASAGELMLRLHHDEDVVVFLNGTEVLRRTGWTREYIEQRIEASLKPGRNVLAIHCHQNGGGQFIDAGLLKIIAP